MTANELGSTLARASIRELNSRQVRAMVRQIVRLGYEGWRLKYAEVEQKKPAVQGALRRIEAAGIDTELVLRAMYDELVRISVS